MKKLLTFVLALLLLAGCIYIQLKTTGGKDAGTGKNVSQKANTEESQNQPAILKVHFLDVGQGDSILVQFPGGRNMLVDAGKNGSAPVIISYLKKNDVKKIDYLVGTHPHEDHIGSLDAVIRNFEIGEVFMPGVTTNTQTFRDVVTAAKNKGLQITAAKAGANILEEGNLSVKILAPVGTEYENLNNYSAVIKVKYGDVSFLLTGDAEELSEKEILAGKADVKAQVLKVGHHGSNSSTSQEFLKAVGPRYAVISVGAGNDYHHPHEATLDRLMKAQITVIRTDEKGNVIFETDGEKCNFTTSK